MENRINSQQKAGAYVEEKHKLSSSVIRWLMVIGAALIVVTSVNVGVQYVKEYITQTQHQEFGYARAAAEYIDGDRISHYAQTLEKDEYYEEVSRYFNTVQKQTDLKYYYVCISTEDGLIYMGRR
ncbi:MAG: hypothetical protein E7495_04825 [Ruminococcus flavefaciens]|nr:hypothetical protein [Ruminococcus flavefaciens]